MGAPDENSDGPAVARRLRAMNDRARLSRDGFSASTPSEYAVMCECPDPACSSMLSIPPELFTEARSSNEWYIVDAAHAGSSTVVTSHGAWCVVRLHDA